MCISIYFISELDNFTGTSNINNFCFRFLQMDNLGYLDSDSDNDTHNLSEDSVASDEGFPDIDRLLLNPYR